MQLLAALLILLVAVAGGLLVLPVWPDAMMKLGRLEQVERVEDPKPEISLDPTTAPEIRRSDAPRMADGAFDIAKIAPDGTSVFAGRSKPNSAVTVFADGEAVGTANTDENGEWVLIVERKFSNPDPTLTLQVSPIVPPSQPPSPVVLTEAAPAAALGAPTSAQLLDQLRHKTEQARADAEKRAAAKSGAMTDVGPSEAGAAALPPTAAALQITAPAAPKAARDVVPVPIKFVFRTAEFTDEGRKAANVLLQYLLVARPASIRLTGHADERGTSAFNMSLSFERLETVAAFLRTGGYAGRVELIPKGDTEPFSGIDRTVIPREQLYDLDRRVELYTIE